MPYRDSVQALTERYEALESQLRASRAHTQSLEELRAQEARIAAELAEVARKLAELRSQRMRLPLLESIAIASPCTASWEKMQGDDRVRFCGECEKNVYNLSAMPRQEAEDLLRSRPDGDICVRLYKRADGTVLTEDCPVGMKRKRRRKLAFGVASAAALTAAAVTSALRASTVTKCNTTTVAMGGPMAIDPTPIATAMGSVAPIVPVAPTVAPADSAGPDGRHMMGGPMVPKPPVHVKMGRMKPAPGTQE